jgi:hypothetical protein
MFRKQYVHIRIIWSYLKKFQKKTFASCALNPKPRNVNFWYDQWRQKHLGPREGKSALEVGTVTVLTEQHLINKPVYQMHAYYLWLIF